MTKIDDGAERVVRFWRAIEMFSAQALPKVDIREHIVDVYPGDPMPCEQSSSLSRKPVTPGTVWRHEVFGGVYEARKVGDTLVGLFGEDDDPAGQREPAAGQSALFAFTVDADGVLAEESAVLSSCAWAIGRALTH